MNQTKGDEISRSFFIGQLRGLFDEATIDDRLREQVDAFLVSINSFLDLLLAVRNLPEGEEVRPLLSFHVVAESWLTSSLRSTRKTGSSPRSSSCRSFAESDEARSVSLLASISGGCG